MCRKQWERRWWITGQEEKAKAKYAFDAIPRFFMGHVPSVTLSFQYSQPCLTSPFPLLQRCSSLHSPEMSSEDLPYYIGLQPLSPFLFCQPYEKSGQHLLHLVSLQLSTRPAPAIWFPLLSFYGNCFLEGHLQTPNCQNHSRFSALLLIQKITTWFSERQIPHLS